MDDPAALARDIAAARDRIAGTAEAILYRSDIMARAGDAARDRFAGLAGAFNGNGRTSAGDDVPHEKKSRKPAFVVVASLVVVVGVVVWFLFRARRRGESQERDAA